LVGVAKDTSVVVGGGVLVTDAQLSCVLQGTCEAGIVGGGVKITTILCEAVYSVVNGPHGGGDEEGTGTGRLPKEVRLVAVIGDVARQTL
jgi:hypothetical protein